MTEHTNAAGARTAITQLFGLYKAEWHNGQLFDYFTEPAYFQELASRRPCVLIGGRGTGKTTVLRGLSYEGQNKMGGSRGKPIGDVPYIGLYYRVNTNRVMAFRGPEMSEEVWGKYFGHYINMTLCGLLVDFLTWYERQASVRLTIPVQRLTRISATLHLGECSDLLALAQELDESKIRFEASINNIAGQTGPNLSLLGAPIDELVATVLSLEDFQAKQAFFLIDEYENFQNYQQQVVNTLIKQASGQYVFKIGVRELGWRERATLNPNEQLTHPADYARIHLREKLTGKRFRLFAARVCNSRLARVRGQYENVIESVTKAFPSLTSEEEASRLGVEEAGKKILRDLARECEPELLEFAKSLSFVQLFFLRFWAEGGGDETSIRSLLETWREKPKEWDTRIGNYLHSALFTARRGKTGIRKYYAGWNTLVRLADGNIRYLLQLVHESFLNHFQQNGSVSASISAENQTKAAQDVGKGNLDELEGLSVEGARLTKLLLGLGRVFGVLAGRPEGHTPEANQFHLAESDALPNGESSENSRKATQLIDLAVMHQALVRFKGTKPIDKTDTKEYDYMIHPIYAAFFVFSHRRKRKLRLTTGQVIGLVERHRETILEILAGQNRPAVDTLPDQLGLFEAYFHGGD